jgi:hypothetical protein
VAISKEIPCFLRVNLSRRLIPFKQHCSYIVDFYKCGIKGLRKRAPDRKPAGRVFFVPGKSKTGTFFLSETYPKNVPAFSGLILTLSLLLILNSYGVGEGN